MPDAETTTDFGAAAGDTLFFLQYRSLARISSPARPARRSAHPPTHPATRWSVEEERLTSYRLNTGLCSPLRPICPLGLKISSSLPS